SFGGTASLALRSALNEIVSANAADAKITHAASAAPGNAERKTIGPTIDSSLFFPTRARLLTFALLQDASTSRADRSRFGCAPRKPWRKMPAHRPWRRFFPYIPSAPPDPPSAHGHVPACARTDAHSWPALAPPPARRSIRDADSSIGARRNTPCRLVLRPTEADIARRLHGALTSHPARARVPPEFRPEALKHGFPRFFDLKKQRSAVAAHEQADGAEGTDASHPDNFEGDVLERVALDEVT